MKPVISHFIFSFFIIFSLVNCEHDTNGTENTDDDSLNIAGTVTYHSDCKNGKSAMVSDTLSCIHCEFDAENNKLMIHHINAGFNCCSQTFTCHISVNGDSVFIEEIEEGEQCWCLCLYDVDIELTGMEAKAYYIKFSEPYAREQEKLTFNIDLATQLEGEFCVTRKVYPWGVQVYEENISGSLAYASECKMKNAASMADTFSCIGYEYDEGTYELTLQHINAAFNCCPGDLTCNISGSNDTITIVESETSPMCNCLCLYDLDIVAEGVQPKMYYVKIIEPYVYDDQPLYFGIDLTNSPEGEYCVTRKSYPWGI